MTDTIARPLFDRLLRGVFFLCVVVLVFYAVAIWVVDAQARTAARNATADGRATLDISAYFPPPLPEDVPNGTDTIEAASLLMGGQRGTYFPREGRLPEDLQVIYQRFRELDTGGGQLMAEDLDHLRATLERRDLLVRALDQATNATRARYQTNIDDVPAAIIVPNLLGRLRFATLLRGRGEVALAEGRVAEAWEDAAKLFRLAHLTNESLPTLINYLVARALAYHGFELTRKLLSAAPPKLDPDALAARRRVLEEAHRIDPAADFSSRLDGERAAIYSTLLDPRATPEMYFLEAEPEEGVPFAARQPFLRRLWTRRQAVRYLDLMTPLFDLCRQPTHTMENSRPTLEAAKPTGGFLVAVWFDCFESAHKRDLWLTSLDHLEIALDLEEIRAETGTYPETLPEVEEGTIDRFTGEPYLYRREGDGYMLYSVSTNGVDDGGTRHPVRKDNGGLDLSRGDQVWRVAHGAEPAVGEEG